jgi:hypothetical protein
MLARIDRRQVFRQDFARGMATKQLVLAEHRSRDPPFRLASVVDDLWEILSQKPKQVKFRKPRHPHFILSPEDSSDPFPRTANSTGSVS